MSKILFTIALLFTVHLGIQAQEFQGVAVYESKTSTSDFKARMEGNKDISPEMQKNMEIQEIIKGVEAIVDGEDFQKNEILSNINIQSLGLDGYISSAEKEKALNDALLQVRVKKNELSIIKEKNENELTKLRLANENLKAANTTSVDKSNLSTSLNNIKSGIETNPMDIRNLSQARVMNILNN